jgi:hypothetical protein
VIAGPITIKHAATRSAQPSANQAKVVCLLIDAPFPLAQMRMLLTRELSAVSHFGACRGGGAG